MKILLATLCLNEMEHLPYLYEQHKDWPNVIQWVFIESADYVYNLTNPELVNNGLSVDGTTAYLKKLSALDNRILHLPFGVSRHKDLAQCKCVARQQYLNVADDVKPDFVFVLDADEFYCRNDQMRINRCLTDNKDINSFSFNQRHIWRPQSIRDKPLFSLEVVKGYWAIPHCRGIRWFPGLEYINNHNVPSQRNGQSLNEKLKRFTNPQCVHLGFASLKRLRSAKHKYYVARGEGTKDKRQWYVDCRAAFESWKPGEKLPHGAEVIPYTGVVPEVFK